MKKDSHIALVLIAGSFAYALPAICQLNSSGARGGEVAEVYRNRSESYQVLGLSKQAQDELEPLDVRVLFSRGRMNYDFGSYRDALKVCDKAIEKDPRYFRSYLLRAMCHLKTGDYQKALEDADKALQLKADPSMVHLLRGEAFDGMRKYSTALDELTAAIQGYPKSAQTFYERAEAYRGLEQYQQAVNDYTQAIELEPDYRAALLGRAWLNHKLGKDADALSDCSRAVKFDINGDLIASNKSVGEIEQTVDCNLGKQSQADLNNALTFYDELLKNKPGDPDILRDRGLVYMHLGKYREAISDFDAANKGDPVNPTGFSGIGRDADYNAARPLYKQGNQDLSNGDNFFAIKHYRSALKLYPKYARCWHNMAIARGRSGDPFAAELCCTHAISYRPDDWKLWYTLALMIHGEYHQKQDDPNRLQLARDAVLHALQLAGAQEARRSGSGAGGSGAGGDGGAAASGLASADDICDMETELHNLLPYRPIIFPAPYNFSNEPDDGFTPSFGF